jgi:hypothetical protein
MIFTFFFFIDRVQKCPRLWSVNDNSSIFSLCMRRQCSGSEPTSYNPEWSNDEIGFDHPLLRLDYILMSRNLFQSLHPTASSSFAVSLKAGIEINNITSHLSDHYPVYASFIPPEIQQLHGHCDVSLIGLNTTTKEKQQSCRIDLFQ